MLVNIYTLGLFLNLNRDLHNRLHSIFSISKFALMLLKEEVLWKQVNGHFLCELSNFFSYILLESNNPHYYMMKSDKNDAKASFWQHWVSCSMEQSYGQTHWAKSNWSKALEKVYRKAALSLWVVSSYCTATGEAIYVINGSTPITLLVFGRKINVDVEGTRNKFHHHKRGNKERYLGTMANSTLW